MSLSTPIDLNQIPKKKRLIFQEIILEPMNAKVVFGLGRLKLSKCADNSTTTQKLSFSKDVVGDHFYDTKKAQAIRYCALTQIEKSTADDERLSIELYEQRMTQSQKGLPEPIAKFLRLRWWFWNRS